MQLPWWGWTLLSVAGFAGTSLITTRLASAKVAPATINVWLFTVGLAAFGLYAWLTKADLGVPAGERWWLLPLAVTVFGSNFALVTAYRCSPNVGYVKAVGGGEIVLVVLVVAGMALAQGRPLGLPWWKVTGMGLCIAGVVLVSLEGNKSPSVSRPAVAGARQAPPSAEIAVGGVMSPGAARTGVTADPLDLVAGDDSSANLSQFREGI
jgi:hypothetical protein